MTDFYRKVNKFSQKFFKFDPGWPFDTGKNNRKKKTNIGLLQGGHGHLKAKNVPGLVIIQFKRG